MRVHISSLFDINYYKNENTKIWSVRSVYMESSYPAFAA